MTKIVAFDTETKGLDWWDGDQQAFMASWADEQGEWTADLSDPAQVQQFIAALDSADVLVCHNLSFDVHQVKWTLGWDALTSGKELHDTDLMSRVMYPEGQRKERGGHGLKNLATIHLDPDAQRPEQHMIELAEEAQIKLKSTGGYYDLWRAYPAVMEKYAAMDARYTYDLYVKFQSEMTEVQRQVYELEQKVAPIFIRAEDIGVRVDPVVVNRLTKQYKEVEREAFNDLVDVLGEQALGGEGSEAALLEALQKQGVPLYRKTDTGKLATNKFALQEFEEDFPFLKRFEELRQARKFLSTYLGPMQNTDVVHTSIRQIGAWTGRSSSARPNMQNIPNNADHGDVRSVFIPREGMCFLVYDYESIEVRLLAYYLNDPGYRELAAHHDPHAWMATQIHGGAVEQYVKGSDGEGIRKKAKNTLFAIVYGAGGKRVTDMNKLDPGPYWDADHPAIVAAREQGREWPKEGYQYREARTLIKKIKDSLPNYTRLNKRIRRKIEAEGFVSTIWGRKNPVKKDKAYVGLNALIQGSAADIMKAGVVAADEVCQPYNAYALLVVHDELLVECPLEHAEELAPLVAAALEGAYDLDPPLAVEGGIVTTNYAEAK